jgi:hypothetical protein
VPPCTPGRLAPAGRGPPDRHLAGSPRVQPAAERLLFEVPQGGTEDLDHSHLAGSLLQQAVGKLKDALTPGEGEEATDRRTPS